MSHITMRSNVDINRLYDRLIANVPGFQKVTWDAQFEAWRADPDNGRVERVPGSGVIRVDYPAGVSRASIQAQEALERAP